MDAARLQEQYTRELEEMTDEIQAGLASGTHSFAELQKLIGEKGREACAVADKLVRENPWAAIGIAAGVGALIGVLLSSRK